MLGDTVWERSGASQMSRQQFMLLMGFSTLAGLALTAVLAYTTTGWIVPVPAQGDAEASFHWVGPVNPVVFFIGVLVTSIVGVFIAPGSDKPAISLVGYAMVAGPFGLLLGPVVGMYEAMSVVKVIFITGMVTAVLTFIGATIPDSLEHWGGWLFGGLCVLILGQFAIPLMGWLVPGFPLQGALTLWDWVGVLLFSAYIIFDMNRAMRVPATVDNAIDCALALYLDIVNLFIRLLQLRGQKKS